MPVAEEHEHPAVRVRFSPEIFRTQRYGGVSRYVVEVHKGLRGLDVDSQILAGAHRNALLHEVDGVVGIDVDALRPGRGRQAITKVVDRALAGAVAGLQGPDTIWHMSYYGHERPRRAPLAVTVHDMIHERFPGEPGKQDQSSALKRAACRAADLIFAVSRDTAEDLQDRFGVAQDRIVVTHLGFTPMAPSHRPCPFGEGRFLLYVGSRRPSYKNWLALLDALREVDAEVGLVCFGAPPESADREAVAGRQLADRVRFASGDDASLAGWYSEAAALVYPSRYEGFGLPPIEALANRCPVVASRAGAISEIVGDLAILVEPEVEALVAGLAEVLAGGENVQRQRREGPDFAARYQWSTTASQTLAGYQCLGP